jgi:hypothetical protein
VIEHRPKQKKHFSLSLDACLREAASAKAGERVGVRVKTLFPPPFHPLPPGEGRY